MYFHQYTMINKHTRVMTIQSKTKGGILKFLEGGEEDRTMDEVNNATELFFTPLMSVECFPKDRLYFNHISGLNLYDLQNFKMELVQWLCWAPVSGIRCTYQ